MTSTSESTFGQRHAKACAILEYLKSITGYHPNNPTIIPTALQTFLDDVQDANREVASQQMDLKVLRKERWELYYGAAGLLNRARQIRDYFSSASPEGTKSFYYITAQKAVQRMTNYQWTNRTDNQDNSEATNEKRISRSERSFGSVLRVGKDILETIMKDGNYSPANANLSIASMTTFLDEIDAKNSEVASTLLSYNDAVSARRKIYDELRFRVMQIKSALSSQYGKDSYEYIEVVRLRF